MLPKQISMRPTVDAGLKLDARGLALLRALLSLEDRLCGAAEALHRPPEPWGVMARLTPALFQWGQGQLSLLQSWTQRLLAAEEWKPVTQPIGCARYCRAFITTMTTTLSALLLLLQ